MTTALDAGQAAAVIRLQNRVFGLVTGGEVYLADVDVPPIDRIAGPEGDLLPIPEGWVYSGGYGLHAFDYDARVFHVDLPKPERVGVMRRVLILSSVTDRVGLVHVGTYCPRVQMVVPPGGSRYVTALLAYLEPGPGGTFTHVTMFGGPGWVRALREMGVQA